MCKPALNVLKRNREQSLFERLDQIRERSCFEPTQDRLDLRPRQFNGIQVRRVGWQINQIGSTPPDQGFNPGDSVRRQIVHEQNVSGLECRDHALMEVTVKHRPIDRPRQNQGGCDAFQADHGQRGRLRSRRLRDAVHHSFTRGRTRIEPREARIDAGFIEKFEPAHRLLRDLFPERAAFPFDPRRVALAGMERLFFRGSFNRTNSRHIILGSDWSLVFCSTRAHNSCKVASGCALTAARMTAWAVAKVRGMPPAWGNGAQLPVARFRANHRSTDGSLTWYRFAAAGIVHLPRSILETTRSRRSGEYGLIPPSMPSIH